MTDQNHAPVQDGNGARAGARRAETIPLTIEVDADQGRFDHQTRAYAEYKVFSTLVRLGRVAQYAKIALAAWSGSGSAAAAGGVLCTVSIGMGPHAHLEVSGRGRHPYAAIDRAAARMSRLLQDR